MSTTHRGELSMLWIVTRVCRISTLLMQLRLLRLLLLLLLLMMMMMIKHVSDEHVAQYDAHLVQSNRPINSRVEKRHERQRSDEVGDDDVDAEQDVSDGRRLVGDFTLRRRRRRRRRRGACTERSGDPRLGVTTANAQRQSCQRREEPQQERQTTRHRRHYHHVIAATETVLLYFLTSPSQGRDYLQLTSDYRSATRTSDDYANRPVRFILDARTLSAGEYGFLYFLKSPCQ